MKYALNDLSRLWQASPSLIVGGIGMVGVLALALVGLAVDPRVVTGAPAWLKPAKFAISTSIYMLTLAWIFTYLGAWQRLRRTVGRTTATVLTFEVALVVVQAARGKSSHFNVATPLDAALFTAMGLAILVLWIASVAVTVALFRQPIEDGALGWAIRLGALIMVLGSASGGLMTRPTEAQLASARDGHRMTVAGAHTVGAPDGGPGMPVTAWSLDRGDLRVAHFLGLHALQVLPLIALVLRRITSAATRQRAILVSAASYISLFGILLAQALNGQPVLEPRGAIVTAEMLWLGATSVALGVVLTSGWRAATPSPKTAMVS